MLFYNCIILLMVFFVVNCDAEYCYKASPRTLGQSHPCRQPFGCASVKYLADIQNFGVKNAVRYSCNEELSHRHPFFAVVPCPHSRNRAKCYDMFSSELIEYDLASGLKLQEQTIGEVLTTQGIEKYCCCKGPECNKINSEMLEFFNPLQDNFRESLNLPDAEIYPGGRIIHSDQTRYNQSALQYYFPSLSLVLFVIFCFVF